MPRNVLAVSVPIIILFLIILIYSILSQEKATVEAFLNMLIGIVVIIVAFSLAWSLFEKMISVHDQGLRTLMYGSSKMKVLTVKLVKKISKIDDDKR